MSRKFSFGVILAVICLAATSCTVQTNHAPYGEMIQTETSSAGGNVKKSSNSGVGRSKEHGLQSAPVYTFKEIKDFMSEHELHWKAYYNVSGERIDMYCEDGTELMFLSPEEGYKDEQLEKMVMVMQNDQFYEQGFRAGYQLDLEQSADLEYYPQTAEYYLSETELMAMNQTDLKIALHEIYARHGKQITEPFLQAVFIQKTWYIPEYEAAAFTGKQELLLNEYETENEKAILAAQKKRGFAEDQEVPYKVPRPIVTGSYMDLDGNGSKEKILIDFIYAGPYEIAKEYMVMINPKAPEEFIISGAIDEMPTAIYAASLDGKTTQLIMCGRMNNGKPRTDIYAYHDGKASLVGQLDANNLEIMEDCFWAYQYDEQQMKMERVKYIYANEMVMETGITEAIYMILRKYAKANSF